ncbi:MAG: hypothetical protein JAY88_14560 [Candidatus Thiodiazotropha lotti]|nr:hypothetical protein [Candidatus Thiodiazotropha lotti]MCW4188285.1 hypothetical protein [Candidatus Thiodiazotropha lotti]
MKNYVFKVVTADQSQYEGYGHGNSAMEAFEDAATHGGVYLPPGMETEVQAMCESGLVIRFTAYST